MSNIDEIREFFSVLDSEAYSEKSAFTEKTALENDPAKEAFMSYQAKTKQIINSKLSDLVSSTSNLRLHAQIKYALLSPGKRLRPLLGILSAQSVGGDRDHVLPLSLACELLHTATLVHDDIIDGDKLRRGILAIHNKWGITDAILVGDALISLAINLAAGYGEEIMKIVSEVGLEICDGEYMDTSLQLSNTSEDEYYLQIKKKSASLFKAAAKCGALASGGSRRETKALTLFGENFGMAYQIRDDLLDLTLHGSFIPKDLKLGRVTLPLIHLYENSDLSDREILDSDLQILCRDPAHASHALRRILGSLKMVRSFSYCEQKMDEYLQRAAVSIKSLPETEFKRHLHQMACLLTPS